MAAEAKVILTAQDRTAAAFRSAKSGMADLQKGAAMARNALGALGVAFSAGAIVSGFTRAAKSAMDYADEVTKASARTGISASSFSTLATAAKEADVEMQTLSKGLRSMQLLLSSANSGAKGAQSTFAALGIELKAFRALKPEDQFLTLVQRISELRDINDRTRAGTEAFGKAWQDLAPFVAEGAAGIKAATDEIERMGGVLSDEQIKTLKDADDAISRMNTQWSALARTLVAEVAPALTNVAQAVSGAIAAGGNRAGQLRSAISAAYEKNGLLFSSMDVVREFNSQTALREGFAAWANPGAVTSAPAVAAPPGYTGITDAPKRSQSSASASSLALALTDAQQAALEAQQAMVAAYYEGVELEADTAKNISAIVDDGLADIDAEMQDTFAGWFTESSELSAFAEQAARNMQTSFAAFLFDPFDQGVKGMLAGFVDVVRQMVAELAAQQLLRSFFAWGSGLGGGVGSFFGALLGGIGGKAAGGPVSAGRPYVVGERGMELFVPSTSGTVVPNHALAAAGGSGVTLNQSISIDARGADAERVIALLPGWGNAIREQTIAEVRALISRGRLT